MVLPNNFGNWTISPTTTSPASSVSTSSQSTVRYTTATRHACTRAEAFNPPMQNGYDSTAYSVNGNGHVHYSQQQSQPAPQMGGRLGMQVLLDHKVFCMSRMEHRWFTMIMFGICS
jgi:hypothetical protein